MPRKILRELAVFAFFAAITIALTWPLAANLGTGVSDLGDPLLNAWILNWDHYAWTHGLSVYQAPTFYPATYPLAFSENLFGIAFITFPFYLAGLSPLTVYNIAFLLGFAFCGYGASVLARLVSRSMTAGILCGALYAFCPFRFDHLPHLQIIWGGWLPLMLAALIAYWRDAKPRYAVLFGATVLMNGLTNVHWLLFGTTAAGLTVAVLALAAGRRPLRFWIQLGASTAVALALLVPVLLPYKTVSKIYGMHREPQEVVGGSATWNDWLIPSYRNSTWGVMPDWSLAKPERVLFPGAMPILLTLAALLLYRKRDDDPAIDAPAIDGSAIAIQPVAKEAPRWLLRTLDVTIVCALLVSYIGAIASRYVMRLGPVRVFSVNGADVPFLLVVVLLLIRLTLAFPRAWRARSLRDALAGSRFPLELWLGVLWIAVGVLGSFGLNAFFHTALYRRVEAFQSIRVPARWAMIAYVGLVATGSLGVAALLRERASRLRAAVIAALVVATFLDIRPRLVWEHDVAVEPVYRWLAKAKPNGPLIELPMNSPSVEYFYTGRNSVHHALQFNGASGFYPPLRVHFESLSKRDPIPDEMLEKLEENGGRFIVVHEDWLRENTLATHAWLRRNLQSGRIGFLRRFDHGPGGDWLFAVTKHVPDWPTLHDTDRDAIGRTADQELEAMLSGKPTYSASAIGRVDAPRYEEEIHPPVTVAGWALAPNGIRGVDILFESGRVRIPADLVDRGDVKALYPWYPRVPKPGFQKVFTKRPRGVRIDTDMAVEIIDGAGRRTRLPDVMVHWK